MEALVHDDYMDEEQRLARAQSLGFDTTRTWYHGTNAVITAFEKKFLGRGNDQRGVGFYFTSSESDANHYTTPSRDQEWKGEGAPNVIPVFLRFRKTFRENMSLPVGQIKALIEAGNQDALDNFGDIAYEGLRAVMMAAVEVYAGMDVFDAMIALSNDFYRGIEGEFAETFERITGFDHVMVDSGDTHHVVIFSAKNVRSIFARFDSDQSESNVLMA